MTTTPKSSRGWQTPAIAAALILFALAPIGLRGENAAAGQAAQASAGKTVDIDNFAFAPATLSVPKGTTVTFTNSSAVSHTATRGGGFTTGVIKPGKAASVRFAQKGSFAYHCLIHPLMRGKVIVH
jgi:plastocyanin